MRAQRLESSSAVARCPPPGYQPTSPQGGPPPFTQAHFTSHTSNYLVADLDFYLLFPFLPPHPPSFSRSLSVTPRPGSGCLTITLFSVSPTVAAHHQIGSQRIFVATVPPEIGEYKEDGRLQVFGLAYIYKHSLVGIDVMEATSDQLSQLGSTGSSVGHFDPEELCRFY